MHISIRLTLASAAALLATSLAAQAGPLVLSVSRTPLSLPIYVADAQGYFAAEGLEVKLQECLGGHRCLGDVMNGRADVATAGDTAMMFRAFESADFYLIATFVTTWDDLKLVTRKPADIKGPGQLAGKTVGVVKGSSSQYFLDSYLLLHGVDPQTVKVVAMQPEQASTLLQSGQVDAVSVWEPFGYQARQLFKDGVSVLPNEGVYNLAWNLVAHRKVIKARDAELIALLRAVRRASDFIRKEPAKAQNILKAKLRAEQAFVDWVWPQLRFRLSLDQALVNNLESQARWAIQEKHIEARRGPNFLHLIYDVPLQAVDPAAVGIVR